MKTPTHNMLVRRAPASVDDRPHSLAKFVSASQICELSRFTNLRVPRGRQLRLTPAPATSSSFAPSTDPTQHL
jgi:hypothetical protein